MLYKKLLLLTMGIASNLILPIVKSTQENAAEIEQDYRNYLNQKNPVGKLNFVDRNLVNDISIYRGQFKDGFHEKIEPLLMNDVEREVAQRLQKEYIEEAIKEAEQACQRYSEFIGNEEEKLRYEADCARLEVRAMVLKSRLENEKGLPSCFPKKNELRSKNKKVSFGREVALPSFLQVCQKILDREIPVPSVVLVDEISWKIEKTEIVSKEKCDAIAKKIVQEKQKKAKLDPSDSIPAHLVKEIQQITPEQIRYLLDPIAIENLSAEE